MCGIAGHWNFTGEDISDETLDSYVDSLKHRGPGSRGVWRNREQGISLGHRRLAVFDLSDKGRQPMQYANGRYWITFNGEIFNFLELEEELKAKGYTFESTCDTEAILAAYQEWGEDCLLKLNGAFAFGIWDNVKQTLFLARDHFGIKPFHYILTDTYFAFASEMKAFLHLPAFELEFDKEIMAETIANVNGLEGTERTLLKGVNRLPGGYCMTMTGQGKVTKRQWWNTYAHIPKDIPTDEKQQIERFKEIFRDSCRLRLRSDLPIVATLSGGLDSSSVTSMTASILKEEGMVTHFDKVYTASFPGTNQEESEHAQAVADFYNLPLMVRTIDLDKNLDKLINDIIWHHEDIYWVLPAGPWLIYQDIKQQRGDVVALDGSGGDEVAIGQSFLIQDDMASALLRFDWARYKELKAILLSMLGGSLDELATGVIPILKRAFLNIGLAQKTIVPLFSRIVTISPRSFLNKQPRPKNLFYPFRFRKPKAFTTLQHSTYVWVHYTGMPTVDRMYDRGPAANTISLRAPLLDYRLVTYAMGLPDDMKVGHGYAKYILREAMKGLMPESVRLRTSKVGFTSPMNKWLKGPLNAWLKNTICDEEFLASSIWNGPAIKKYVEREMELENWDKISLLWPIFHAFHTMRIFTQAAQDIRQKAAQ